MHKRTISMSVDVSDEAYQRIVDYCRRYSHGNYHMTQSQAVNAMLESEFLIEAHDLDYELIDAMLQEEIGKQQQMIKSLNQQKKLDQRRVDQLLNGVIDDDKTH